VQIPIAEAWPLPTGQYYVYELEGLEVCTEEGESLGHLTDVLFTGANPILVTQGPRGEILIPKLKEVVLKIDPEAGRITVRLPPGLVDPE